MLLLSSADFFKINFFEKFFQEHYQGVKQFGHSVGPDMGSNCLQRLSTDDKNCRGCQLVLEGLQR